MNPDAVSPADEAGLLDRLAAPILLARFDGAITRLNPAARELLRACLDNGEDAAPTCLQAAYPHARLADLKREPQGTVLRMLIGVRRREDGIDGALITLDARLSRVGDDLIMIEGVTESAARREIQRLTEQLVALSFGYPDMRVEVTADGTILDFVVANPAELNIQPERLLERCILNAFPPPAGEMLQGAIRSFADGAGPESASFSLNGPAGEQFFEARFVGLGDADRILLTIRNVTDRVRAEREAARIRDRLVEALESITDGFVLYDQNDRLVLANSRYREMFDPGAAFIAAGARFEDVLAFTARSGVYSFGPEFMERWLEERLRLHRGGGAPMEAQLADGRWLRIQERLTPAGDRVGLRTDITELKRREAELQDAREAAEKASEQKTGFVHHLSHELRTPLNAVLGFAQMIAEELLGPAGNPRYPVYARQIAEAGAYMLELINNLLDLAKIEAGRLTLSEEACELPMVVDLIFSMIGERAKRSKVELVSLLDEDSPRLVADPTLVRQMLTNLIANAIKFSPSDGSGRVVVTAERTADGGLILAVRDNGAGMSPEQIPRALSPFEQVHDRKVTPEVGTGLGLPLTRALVELHGGRFVIESALGAGTTARLIFPPSRVACLMGGDGI